MFLPQVLNVERVKALETWLKATDTNLKQVNGQRKYGGPPEGERLLSSKHTAFTQDDHEMNSLEKLRETNMWN